MRQPLIFEHVSGAIYSLKTTRTRTLLTILGITVGIMSLTAILALSAGVTRVVSHQVDELGGNLAVIRPSVPSRTVSELTTPVSQQFYSTSTLTDADVVALRELPGVTASAPLMMIHGTLRTERDHVDSAPVLATTPDFFQMTKLTTRDGQVLEDIASETTAVIGAQLAVDLFGTDKPIGQMFTLRGHEFTVIGVLKRTNNPINYNNIDTDNAAIITLEAGKSMHRDAPQIQQINIQADDAARLPGVVDAANRTLTEKHQGEHDFTIVYGDEIAAPTSQLFAAITGVMAAITAISLVVGGIGIMNIMLVGVAERTREIGLRKAVGASDVSIVNQFLIEALLMSIIGGIIGYLAGYIVAFAISTQLTFNPAFTWQIAATAVGVAVVVGVVFGLYPAARAARKDPIESLRQYH